MVHIPTMSHHLVCTTCITFGSWSLELQLEKKPDDWVRLRQMTGGKSEVGMRGRSICWDMAPDALFSPEIWCSFPRDSSHKDYRSYPFHSIYTVFKYWLIRFDYDVFFLVFLMGHVCHVELVDKNPGCRLNVRSIPPERWPWWWPFAVLSSAELSQS